MSRPNDGIYYRLDWISRAYTVSQCVRVILATPPVACTRALSYAYRMLDRVSTHGRGGPGGGGA